MSREESTPSLSAAGGKAVTRPRLLMAGRTRYRLPLEDGLRRKFEALEGELELKVIGTAPPGSPTADGAFRLVGPARPRVLDGALFYPRLALRIAGELSAFRPDAVAVQSPYEAAAALAARRLARARVPIVLDVHGDWRTATRLYGSAARRLLNPVTDLVARTAVRRADAVRTISGFTTGLVRELGVEPAAVFPAFMDLGPFLSPPRPLPETPSVLFVGVLERHKDVDALAEAWRLAAPRVPGVKLHVVGRGSRGRVVEALVRELPEQTTWTPALSPPAVAEAMDGATAVVLPSRSEGLGRVVVEACCRARPVVATRVGGITDLVTDGVTGLLVEPRQPAALADAVVRLVSDRALAERLGRAARAGVGPWLATPEEYAARVRSLVDRVTERR